MRKILIAALVLAAGCDATRRDYTYCDNTYSDCKQGFVCNPTTGMCEAERADASDAPSLYDAGTEDAIPGEAGQDLGRDVSIMEGGTIDGVPGMLDGSAGEVSTQGEAGGIDGGVPDAPGSCLTATDCTSSLLPFCVNGMCVACKDSSHCSNLAGTPFCTAQNTCVSCVQAPASFCASSTPILPACDSVSGRCVECTASTDCRDAAKPICLANTCVECAGNSHCTKDPAKAFCASNHTCGGCNAPGASAGSGGVDGGASSDGGSGIDGGVLPACIGAKPVCATTGTMAGQCVECQDNTACTTPTLPICTNNTCSKCTADSQCTAAPRICMFHLAQDAGRCATEAETIYVKNDSATCITSGTSTETTPFCQPQNGIDAVSATKRLVVITGGTVLRTWVTPSSWTTTQQVSVIGKQQPIISPGGAEIGVHITNGNLYIRGLTVQGAGATSTQPGIVVDSGAILGLDRCYLMGNAGGLLVHAGAGFDVANSVFAKNITGTGDFGVFGGVSLGTVGAGLPGRFWFNTVVDNQQFGVVCTNTSQELDAVLLFGNVGGNLVNCTINQTSGAENIAPSGNAGPGFTTSAADFKLNSSTYHLTALSPGTPAQSLPCKDWIVSTPTNHPPDDIDGDLRPYPSTGKLDCGADEYLP